LKPFVKFVVIIVLAAGLVIEVGSPLWTRSTTAGAANDAAAAAARDYFDSANLDSAKAAATQAAAVRGMTLTRIRLETDGSITVWVTHQAKSYVLHNISALKNWYNVTASANAPPIRS
jgi:Flp pilus assembly protein TadG